MTCMKVVSIMAYEVSKDNFQLKDCHAEQDNFSEKICIKRKFAYLCNPKTIGVVAQVVEQWTENPCVAGSTPADTTFKKAFDFFRMPFALFFAGGYPTIICSAR